jgi:hypothetical protein
MKCIILPRQARDKHRENSKKGRFLQEVNTTNNDGSGIVDMYCGGEWSLTELSIRRYVT